LKGFGVELGGREAKMELRDKGDGLTLVKVEDDD
jgi:hypothetical protein